MDNAEIILAPKKKLLEKVVFLDGLSRAGKFLLGKVVSNYKKVDFFQYAEVLEHIPIIEHLGLMENRAACALFQIQLELFFYNRVIGRNLNLRESDGSCIANGTQYENILERSRLPDGNEAVKRFHRKGLIPAFLVHECLPHVRFFLQAYPEMLMINIQRHPVDIAHSWFVRGWGNRFGQDPLAFMPVIEDKDGSIPWFAQDWDRSYLLMNEKERVLMSISSLMSRDHEAYNGLDADEKKQILFVPYELFIEKPLTVTAEIAHFLEDEPFENMEEILMRERVFRKLPLSERESKKRELISGDVSGEIIELFQNCIDEYETCWFR
jgi:hypothetical protein